MAGKHILQKGLMQAIHINFDLGLYKNVMQSATQKQTDLICNKLERKEVFFASPEGSGLQPEMKDILYAIKNCKFQGDIRLLYLEAKALELFSYQVLQLQGCVELPRYVITSADKEKLKAVYSHIEENYLLPQSLKGLSQTFMLNEFKLKKGYKTLFNTTVFSHIYHLRMTKAKQLLAEENMNVSLVSDFMGYNNIAAFSAAFSKRFGYPPSKFSNK
jgi:AraC-like DNA-binding protein